MDIPRTLWQLARRTPAFRRSLRQLDGTIERTRPDVLVNFLEPLTGVAGLIQARQVPVLSVGHQFMLRHPAFPETNPPWLQWFGLSRYVDLTGRRSVRYGLSFYEAEDIPEQDLLVGPPLLRDELRELDGTQNHGHFLVYLLNAGYRAEIEAWHQLHREIPLQVFCDRPAAEDVERVDPTLTFHRLHGEKFLRLMATCRAVVTTAGFESLAEAAWLGKPVLAVPVENHLEQMLNAVDAGHAGLALGARRFELDRLLTVPAGNAQHRFRKWVDQSDVRLLRALQHTLATRPTRESGGRRRGLVPAPAAGEP